MPCDDLNAVVAGSRQLLPDLLRIHVPQSDDLIVQPGVLCHLVVVGGQQGDGLHLVEVFGHCLHDDGALVGVGAPCELIQQEQGVALLHLLQRLLELHDLRAEAGQARLDGLQVVKEHLHAVKQRHPGLLGADQKARLQKQHVQSHGFHHHGLTAHVGAGDDGGPLLQPDGHRHEGPPLLLQQVAQLGVDHVRQLQLRLRDLRPHAAVAHGKQRLLDDEVQPARRVGVLQQISCQRSQRLPHAAAHLGLLAVLLGTDTGPAGAQLLLLGIGLCMVQLLLDLLLGRTDLPQLGCCIVGDVEATAAGLVRIQDLQRLRRIMEGQRLKVSGLAHLLEQGDQTLQPLEIYLDFKQLHMIRDLQRLAPAQRATDVLHLAQHQADPVVQWLQSIRRLGGLLHVIQLRLQLLPLVGGVIAQLADLLLTEGAAPVESLQRILQADFFSLLKANIDHASSSFTLMTGTSTASRIRVINSSLSNFQP